MEEADQIRIDDIERRLRVIEMLAQPPAVTANVYEINGGAAITGRGYAQLWRESEESRARMWAENMELRRTISLMAKAAAEAQDNFRLIAELAADPADEKRKEPKP